MSDVGFFSDFFDSGKESNQPYQPPLNVQNFMQPVSVSEMQKVGVYGNLLSDKQGYDNANAQMNLWNQELAKPDLSDEDKQTISGYVQYWGNQRDAHAQSAESTRQTAAQLGIDVSNYGSDKTLAQAGQAFQDYRNVGAKNFLNLPTLAELEENRRRELLSRGVSPRTAGIIVGRERDKFREQLSRRYTDGLTAYGTNPDGSLDQDIGMQLLRGLKDVDPATATMFYNGFATPLKVFDANQAQSLALLGNTAAMDRLAAQIKANWENAQANRAATRSNLEYATDAQAEENERNREHAANLEAFRLGYRMLYGNNSGKKSKFMQDVEDLENSMGINREGITDEERAKIHAQALTIATKENFPKGIKTDNELFEKFIQAVDAARRAGADEQSALEFGYRTIGMNLSDNDKEMLAAQNLFSNNHGEIERAIRDGNKALALELIQQTRELLGTETYKKLFEKDNYQNRLDRLDVYERIANSDPRSYEDAQWLIEQQFISEKGRRPTRDELLALVSKADKDGTLLIMPKPKKVETPPLAPTTPPPSVVTQPPPWQSSTNHAGALPYGYGTRAWRP